jgi:hypothetical protein
MAASVPDDKKTQEQSFQEECDEATASERPSRAPVLCPGETMVRGKNRFGRMQWTWYVFKSPSGRFMCPYCSYQAFRHMQLKYHFMAQHVWLQEFANIDIHEESSSASSSVTFSSDDTPYLNVK